MLEFNSTVRDQRKWMLYLLSVLLLGAAFTPYRRLFFGLILGTAVSFLNLWLLQRRVEKVSQAAPGEIPKGGVGTFRRLASAVLVAFIATRYEDTFNIYAVVVGLLTSYVVMTIGALISVLANAKKPAMTINEEKKIEKR